MNNEFLITLFIIFLMTIIIGFAYVTSKLECTSKADALGYKANYAFFQGCVLEKSNGKKILLEQLRDFEN